MIDMGGPEGENDRQGGPEIGKDIQGGVLRSQMTYRGGGGLRSEMIEGGITEVEKDNYPFPCASNFMASVSCYCCARTLTPVGFKQHKCQPACRQAHIRLLVDPTAKVASAPKIMAREYRQKSNKKKAAEQNEVVPHPV